MTPKQLRSAAHALRTAANALEAVTTQLRTLSTEIDTPDDKITSCSDCGNFLGHGHACQPTPAWPTAPFVWHDGKVWARDGDGDYATSLRGGARALWIKQLLQSPDPGSCDYGDVAGFAREAVPVVMVPAAEWWAFRASVTRGECHLTEAALIDATDALGQPDEDVKEDA